MPDKIEKKEFMVEPEFNMPIKKSLIKLLSGIPTQAKDMAANRKLLSATQLISNKLNTPTTSTKKEVQPCS